MNPPSPPSHVPVMLAEVLGVLKPVHGEIYVDGTFGAGGYSRAILAAANCRVIALDRDPAAIAGGAALAAASHARLTLVHSAFSGLKSVVEAQGHDKVDGVVLDVGVSSMQIDEAARGFSFMRDGPLDMRMSQSGQSAADLVNSIATDDLSRIIFILGDEPRARAIARAIVKTRDEAALNTTSDLVRAIERATGPQRAKDRTHPATKTFQALRIYVNAELEELAEALGGAEDILREGGRLVVVTFHSLEDRIVKRFFTARSGNLPSASRHMPETYDKPDASFMLPFKGHMVVSDVEAATNPRARSAKLRAGIRTAADSWPLDHAALAVPQVESGRR